MAHALSIPTPDALMHFTRFASRYEQVRTIQYLHDLCTTAGGWNCGQQTAVGLSGSDSETGSDPDPYTKAGGGPSPKCSRNSIQTRSYRACRKMTHSPRTGDFSPERLDKLIDTLAKRTKRNLVVRTRKVDFGRNLAGWVTGGADDEPLVSQEGYEPVWNVSINRLLTPAEQFTTLLHELGHLFCGHLGAFEDNNLKEEEYGWPDRSTLPHFAREIEAELVAWWLAEREGIITGSPIYLKPYIERAGDEVGLVDLDRVTRAVARVRSYLGDKA